jgi:hypothetical protein
MADKEKSDSDKTGESKSQKTGNLPWLLAVSAANLVVFGVLTAIDPEPISKLAKSWEFILPAGAGLALICVINGLLSAEAKSRLVFWKWQDPLPGHEAYTVHAKNDPRFSQADVVEKLRLDQETMDDPKKQNAHWYKNVYTPTRDAPSVEQASRNWLFTRDYAAMSFMMIFLLGAAGYLIITPVIKWLIYVAGLIVQYLLVLWAARNYGVETVTNAIAVRTATPTGAGGNDIT